MDRTIAQREAIWKQKCYHLVEAAIVLIKNRQPVQATKHNILTLYDDVCIEHFLPSHRRRHGPLPRNYHN